MEKECFIAICIYSYIFTYSLQCIFFFWCLLYLILRKNLCICLVEYFPGGLLRGLDCFVTLLGDTWKLWVLLVGGDQIKYSRIKWFINIKASWEGWLFVSLFSKVEDGFSLLTSQLAGPMTWGNLQTPARVWEFARSVGGQEAKYVWSAYFGLGMCPLHSNRQISSSARKSLDVCSS